MHSVFLVPINIGPGFWSRVPVVGPGFYSLPNKSKNKLQGLVFGLRLSVIVNNTKVLGCVAVVKAIISHLNELLCGKVM